MKPSHTFMNMKDSSCKRLLTYKCDNLYDKYSSSRELVGPYLRTSAKFDICGSEISL
jgi:hypothetical protein